jgi:hypothetical protein
MAFAVRSETQQRTRHDPREPMKKVSASWRIRDLLASKLGAGCAWRSDQLPNKGARRGDERCRRWFRHGRRRARRIPHAGALPNKKVLAVGIAIAVQVAASVDSERLAPLGEITPSAAAWLLDNPKRRRCRRVLHRPTQPAAQLRRDQARECAGEAAVGGY